MLQSLAVQVLDEERVCVVCDEPLQYRYWKKRCVCVCACKRACVCVAWLETADDLLDDNLFIYLLWLHESS